jgi:2-iminobutanoate/2-iminopropanoate deaminase
VRVPVATARAPRAIGPYSQAIRAGSFLFLSGQTPIDPGTGELVAGDITVQTRQALTNLGEVLRAAGGSFAHVTRTTVFLADMNDFPAMNEVYAGFFEAPYPARTTIQAARLPKDCRVEIDAIALFGENTEF